MKPVLGQQLSDDATLLPASKLEPILHMTTGMSLAIDQNGVLIQEVYRARSSSGGCTCHDQEHGGMHPDGPQLARQALEGVHALPPQEHLVALALQDAAQLAHVCVRQRKRQIILRLEMDPLR